MRLISVASFIILGDIAFCCCRDYFRMPVAQAEIRSNFKKLWSQL